MSEQVKSILVTGAGGGIGLVTTRYLAARGFHVYAGVRNVADTETLAKIPNITPIKLDVTKTRDVLEAKNLIEQKRRGLFGLVNNAGITKVGPLMDVSVEDLCDQFEVNLFGVHRVTRMFFPLLLAAGGRIVMMSSDSGFFATPFVGPYCASKHALEGYADSLRREIISFGMKVIIIEPGRIQTPIWAKAAKDIASLGLDQSMFRKEAMAMGRYAIRKGTTGGLPPEDVARVVYAALTAAKPKLRYMVADNKLEYHMMKILPAGYIDKLLMAKIRKVTREENP